MTTSKGYRVSLDLDGVIAKTERWVFRMFNAQRLAGGNYAAIDRAEIEYYASRPLLHHPSEFLSHLDTGIIVTSRKPIAHDITRKWLRKQGIGLHICYSDANGGINWDGDYKAASQQAAEMKAGILQAMNIDVHFDNNPHIVKWLRKNLPSIITIQIGGERE